MQPCTAKTRFLPSLQVTDWRNTCRRDVLTCVCVYQVTYRDSACRQHYRWMRLRSSWPISQMASTGQYARSVATGARLSKFPGFVEFRNFIRLVRVVCDSWLSCSLESSKCVCLASTTDAMQLSLDCSSWGLYQLPVEAKSALILPIPNKQPTVDQGHRRWLL